MENSNELMSSPKWNDANPGQFQNPNDGIQTRFLLHMLPLIIIMISIFN